MFKKAKKLIVGLWIIKLLFISVGRVNGEVDRIDIQFPDQVDHVSYKSLSYRFHPVTRHLDLDSITAMIRKELVKYGPGCLPRTEIIILERIEDLNNHDQPSGEAIAGLFAPGKTVSRIYLEAGAYMVNALHHEMASILMHQYYLKDPGYRRACRQFMKYLKKGFSYRGMEGELNFMNDHWQFLGSADYAVTNPENDYSLVAEYLFNPRPLKETSGHVPFWLYMDWAEVLEYPVYEKVQRVIALFREIDPRFTESYFRSLSTAGHQAMR
jgi:hypothetical protein